MKLGESVTINDHLTVGVTPHGEITIVDWSLPKAFVIVLSPEESREVRAKLEEAEGLAVVALRGHA